MTTGKGLIWRMGIQRETDHPCPQRIYSPMVGQYFNSGENCGRFLRRKESIFKKITLLCLELFGEKQDKAEEYNNDIEGFSQVTLCYLPIKLFYLMYLLMLLLHGCAFLN